MQPQYEDEEAINPFDFWKGANFKIKIRNVEGYRNYDSSEFASVSGLNDDDEELQGIWNQQHSLTEFVDLKHFRSYEELKRKLEMVLSGSASTMSKADEIDLQEEQAVVSKPKAKAAPRQEIDLDEDDESLSYFAKLANDD